MRNESEVSMTALEKIFGKTSGDHISQLPVIVIRAR